MIVHEMTGFGPKRLRTEPLPAPTPAPSPRLAELEDALAESEEQNAKALAEWQASDDDPFLYRVYRAGIAHIDRLRSEIDRLTGGQS